MRLPKKFQRRKQPVCVYLVLQLYYVTLNIFLFNAVLSLDIRIPKYLIGFFSSKTIFTDRSKAALILWIIFVIYVWCLACLLVFSLQPCGHLMGKD